MDDDIIINTFKRVYNKVLVIPSHEFITAETRFTLDNQYYMWAASVNNQSKPQNNVGFINLAGCKARMIKKEDKSFIMFKGYLNVELDVNLNPSMLKQPVVK